MLGATSTASSAEPSTTPSIPTAETSTTTLPAPSPVSAPVACPDLNVVPSTSPASPTTMASTLTLVTHAPDVPSSVTTTTMPLSSKATKKKLSYLSSALTATVVVPLARKALFADAPLSKASGNASIVVLVLGYDSVMLSLCAQFRRGAPPCLLRSPASLHSRFVGPTLVGALLFSRG